MRRIPNLRSIDPISYRPLRPGLRSAISQAMKRAIVVIACCCAVLIDLRTAVADFASDREMANRYEQAAQAGDDDAQFYLGALYSTGVGRARSDEEAFRWFSRAADQGHSHAMLIVAGLYASGRGIAKDNVKAYSWAYIVSSASKVDEYRNGARQLMSLLMNRMTSDEIGRAVVAARAWRAGRVAGAGKASGIERAAESSSDQPAPASRPRSCSQRPQPRHRPWSRSRRHHPTSRHCRRPPRPIRHLPRRTRGETMLVMCSTRFHRACASGSASNSQDVS